MRGLAAEKLTLLEGRIAEMQDACARLRDVLAHWDTLLAAAPIPDPVIERTRPRRIIKGELPSPLNPPAGCVFHPRCPLAFARCRVEEPPLFDLGEEQLAACWLAEGGRRVPNLVDTDSTAPAPEVVRTG